MPTIHVLPENLANRIAAGEVVERPASVVKELVENAIDAGASRIEIELREGGRKLIKVADDGCGMAAEDLLMAVQRFATSKIAEADDLDRILTMGFRGEALPSIGAVAQLRLTSRPHDAAEGATLTVAGGSVDGPHSAGCPPGTTIEVSNLFFNTPARLKFLATTATERGHCLDWVQHLALSRPEIAFKVVHDGQTVFTSAGQGDLRSVLAAIYGSGAAREFLPVEVKADELRIRGYISGPKLTRATRTHQFFFVNHRFVRSRQLSHALGEAYGLLLPSGKSPLCAVHFQLPPEEVDPNVHPTKIEIRFRHQARVHQLFGQACAEALAAAGFRSLSSPSLQGG
ncbi:MAG: DNA mismatch repair endonuclease MutL, partial [Armatimonadetes bacterium]|nr:DNA mismatch repair endonuclease MutL [Armatimonadota bacterium]